MARSQLTRSVGLRALVGAGVLLNPDPQNASGSLKSGVGIGFSYVPDVGQ
jgi:hypothetical protein